MQSAKYEELYVVCTAHKCTSCHLRLLTVMQITVCRKCYLFHLISIEQIVHLRVYMSFHCLYIIENQVGNPYEFYGDNNAGETLEAKNSHKQNYFLKSVK